MKKHIQEFNFHPWRHNTKEATGEAEKKRRGRREEPKSYSSHLLAASLLLPFPASLTHSSLSSLHSRWGFLQHLSSARITQAMSVKR
ncbi:hypothetical protein E2C01_026929 [Portunus trituberculatus]|uniref:Uncharacterized protein n=1 Tax=Portunus trituberculatus TaxID=210409 RepID=A0A5B7EME1_PORTR|nr:hypothetical protein [Portunus trituberculatus]